MKVYHAGDLSFAHMAREELGVTQDNLRWSEIIIVYDVDYFDVFPCALEQDKIYVHMELRGPFPLNCDTKLTLVGTRIRQWVLDEGFRARAEFLKTLLIH